MKIRVNMCKVEEVSKFVTELKSHFKKQIHADFSQFVSISLVIIHTDVMLNPGHTS